MTPPAALRRLSHAINTLPVMRFVRTPKLMKAIFDVDHGLLDNFDRDDIYGESDNYSDEELFWLWDVWQVQADLAGRLTWDPAPRCPRVREEISGNIDDLLARRPQVIDDPNLIARLEWLRVAIRAYPDATAALEVP